MLYYAWNEHRRAFESGTLFTRPAPGKDAADTVEFMHNLLTKFKFRTDSLESLTSDSAPVSLACTVM
jgi:hypothetical protein